MRDWFGNLKRVLSETTIEVVLLAVGVVTTILSIWYTTLYHLETGDQWIVAVSFSASIVVFLVILFEFATKLVLDGKRWKAVAIYGFWLVLVLYSMQSTVAGQYTNTIGRRIGNERARMADEDRESQNERDAVRERERQESLRFANEEIGRLGKVLGQGVGADGKPLANWQIAEYQKRLDAWTLRAEKLKDAWAMERDEQRGGEGLRLDTGSSHGSVYDFYAVVLGLKSEKVEFGLAVFKGVILDLMNVVCFMIVMMREQWRMERLKREIEEEEKRKVDPKERRKKVAEQMARLAFGKSASRNGMFPSWKTAQERLGLNKGDYEWMVDKGIMNGVLVMRHGKVYRGKDLNAEDFLEDIVDEND